MSATVAACLNFMGCFWGSRSLSGQSHPYIGRFKKALQILLPQLSNPVMRAGGRPSVS